MLIIGVSGKKGSGKTTFANQVRAMAGGCVGEVSFASALKDFCVNVLGVPKAQCCGSQAEKERLTDICWPNSSDRMTGREVMQFFGTDIMREWVPDIWVRAAMQAAKKSKCRVVLVPDVRFANEAEAIRDAGGKLVRLLRTTEVDAHVSETALDDYEGWDLVVPANIDGVEAQADFIRPIVDRWLGEGKETP